MIRIGITGGVGMGKSSIARALVSRRIPVIDTDDIAREVVRPGEAALREIVEAFGPEVIDVNGELRRSVLADRVFSDASARQRLESIVHPRIREQWQSWLQGHWNGTPAAAVVIPLLFETAAESSFDNVVCVACSGSEQLKRLSARGWSREQSAQRIAAQLPTAEKLARAHYVIWTDGEQATSEQQLDLILASLGPSSVEAT